MSIYDFKVTTIDGQEITLEDYRGKVLLIVNTASKCGFTPQYAGLQQLYTQYHDQGLEVLGFPSNQFAGQEPGDESEIKNFCSLKYDVTFPLFRKIDVRDAGAHPLFQYLTSQAPFKGLDLAHPIGKKLAEVLETRFPHLLEGDSIKWNFTKFLIDRNGKVIARYEPTTEPEALRGVIEKLL